MSSQYSGDRGDNYSENSTESHIEDDNSITTEERDENSSESSDSEEEQSSITTENSPEQEIDPWNKLINDAAPKIWKQYDDILQALLIHHESDAKKFYRTCIPKRIGRCLQGKRSPSCLFYHSGVPAHAIDNN